MKPTKTWKEVERRFAGYFGSQRTALSGGNGKVSRSDSLHPALFIETKQRKRSEVASWFWKARELAVKEGKTPIVGLHMTGKRQWLLVCDIRDLPAVAAEYAAANVEERQS